MFIFDINVCKLLNIVSNIKSNWKVYFHISKANKLQSFGKH